MIRFDVDNLRDIIGLVQDSDVAEMTLRNGDAEVIIRSVKAFPAPVMAGPLPAPLVAAAAPPPSAEGAKPSAAAPPVETGYSVRSPMVGTFYVGPAPDKPPFVTLGAEVKKGQTLGIIEAMKMLNPIESEVNGQVRAIKVLDGHAVEYGEVLFIIEESPA